MSRSKGRVKERAVKYEVVHQRHKGTEAQRHRGTEAQRHRGTEAQKGTEAQEEVHYMSEEEFLGKAPDNKVLERITEEEFMKLPRKEGWRYEYYGGRTHITPRPISEIVKFYIFTRVVNIRYTLQCPQWSDISEISSLFFAAFLNSIDFFNQTPREVRSSAYKEIKKTFDGGYGKMCWSLSRIAMDNRKMVGCALITFREGKYYVTWVFVHPEKQREGIATLIVQDIANNLYTKGITELYSAYLIASEVSAAWHKSFGFIPAR